MDKVAGINMDLVIEVNIFIPIKAIADLIITAIEGGSEYWCGGCHYVKGDVKAVTFPWYANPELYASDFEIKILERESDGSMTPHVVKQDDIRKALRLMSEIAKPAFTDLLEDNADAETADIFLQLLTLGEIRYS